MLLTRENVGSQTEPYLQMQAVQTPLRVMEIRTLVPQWRPSQSDRSEPSARLPHPRETDARAVAERIAGVATSASRSDRQREPYEEVGAADARSIARWYAGRSKSFVR